MSSQPDLSSLRIAREPTADASSGSPSPAWKFPTLIVVAILCAGGAWWWLKGEPAVPVKVGVVLVQGGGGTSVASSITANGYVVARRKAVVSARMAGRLDTLSVEEGSQVGSGEVIGRLESKDYEAQVDSARAQGADVAAQLKLAQANLRRQTDLAKQRLVADSAVEDTQAQVDMLNARVMVAAAQVKVAEANLENTRIRAPFAGTVLKKSAELGEVVGVSGGSAFDKSGVVTIADLSTLEVEVDVNEAYIAKVEMGQPARITLDAYSTVGFAGVVRQVVPTADRQKATVLVKVTIQDRDPRILPEMAAKVTFLPKGEKVETGVTKRVLVPRDAVIEGATGKSVWVVTSDPKSKRDVATSRQVQVNAVEGNPTAFEVMAGVTGGERVVLKPDAALGEGTRVDIQP